MAAFLDLRVVEMRSRLVNFRELNRRLDPAASPAMTEISVSWDSPQGTLGQWLKFVETSDGMVTAAGTAGIDELSGLIPYFRGMLGSIWHA